MLNNDVLDCNLFYKKSIWVSIFFFYKNQQLVHFILMTSEIIAIPPYTKLKYSTSLGILKAGVKQENKFIAAMIDY
jgi:hypothetical protein